MLPCTHRRLFRAAAYSTSASIGYSRARDRSSNNSLKRSRPSQSVSLIAALRAAGLDRSLPSDPLPGKTDYSYLKPGSRNNQIAADTISHRPLLSSSLQSSVASLIQQKFINDLQSGLETYERQTLENELSPLQLQTLASRNYDVTDVFRWASIIVQPDTTKAATLLVDYSLGRSATKPIPIFVLLFLLRRRLSFATTGALRSLITVAWHELHRHQAKLSLQSESPSNPDQARRYQLDYPVATTKSILLIVIRLLRFARHVWPKALPTISSIFTHTFRLNSPTNTNQARATSQRRRQDRLSRLGQSCNKFLELLALPCSRNPFLNVPICQSAQFHVLEFMAKHDPPLAISRHGYRAVISLHLASKKTLREREWHQLKAKSWPPWKEDRTGFDADKGPEYGLPNTMKALHQLSQAGYSFQLWEKVAQIFAGWDLDHSPTIQTRSFLLFRGLRQHLQLDDSVSSQEELDVPQDSNPHVWAARITATRTVQEAWAAFLSFQDRLLPPSEIVYRAMLEKLASRVESPSEDAREEGNHFIRSLDAGDAKEQMPIPSSPREITYTRLPVPTFEGLAEEMIRNEIYPSPQTLAVLLNGTTELSKGIKYIEYGAHVVDDVSSLVSDQPEKEPKLQKVPKIVFSAFIRLLCTVSISQNQEKEHSSSGAAWWERRPLRLAQRLLEAYTLRDVSLFNQFLGGFLESLETDSMTLFRSDEKHSISEIRLVYAVAMIRRHEDLLNIYHKMKTDGLKPDAHTFQIQCRNLSSLILATRELGNNRLSINYLRHSKEQLMDRINNEHAPNIRSLFIQIFHGETSPLKRYISRGSNRQTFQSSDPVMSDLPRLLEVPAPHVLHAYIRVLGLMHQDFALLDLAKWMRSYRHEINAAAEEPRGGQRMLRKCHVAMRAYTEHSWERKANKSDGLSVLDEAIPRQHVGKNFFSSAGSQLQKHKGLGGPKNSREQHFGLKHVIESAGWKWPDDTEVTAYLARAHPFEKPHRDSV